MSKTAQELEAEYLKEGMKGYTSYPRDFREAQAIGKDFYVTEESGRVVGYTCKEGVLYVRGVSESIIG